MLPYLTMATFLSHFKKWKHLILKKSYIDVNGVQVNEDTGEIRTDKSINHSLYSSKNRTINKIYEYAFSNVWDYFFTFTFNPEKVNRYDYDECYKKLSRFLRDFKYRKCKDLKYLVVPEMHKDGAFHFHALISNLDIDYLVDSGKKFYGNIIYNFNAYKLGFSTATKINDSKKVSSYITKYITKELNTSLKGKHRYLISENVHNPTITENYIDKENFNSIKMELLSQASYFKEVKSEKTDLITTYIHLDTTPKSVDI